MLNYFSDGRTEVPLHQCHRRQESQIETLFGAPATKHHPLVGTRTSSRGLLTGNGYAKHLLKCVPTDPCIFGATAEGESTAVLRQIPLSGGDNNLLR